MSTGNDDSSSSNKHFTFTIENGVVTAYFEVENGISQQESIDSQDFFEINGVEITHVKQTSNGAEEVVYSDPERDGSYTIISDSTNTGGDDNSSGEDNSSGNDDRPGSGDRKGYQFTINDNNEVTEVFEIKDGVPELKPIDDDGTESYAVADGNVIRTDIEDFGSEITTYADADGDGTYYRIAEQWASDSPGTGPFKIEDRLVYSPSDDNDKIAVRSGEDCHGGGGKDDFVIREAGNLRIGDYSASDDDFVVFDTGLGLASKEELQGYVTDLHYEGADLVVVFGSAATITLVGVPEGQISWDDVSVLS